MVNLAICLQPYNKTDVALDREGDRNWDVTAEQTSYSATKCRWPLSFFFSFGELKQTPNMIFFFFYFTESQKADKTLPSIKDL